MWQKVLDPMAPRPSYAVRMMTALAGRSLSKIILVYLVVMAMIIVVFAGALSAFPDALRSPAAQSLTFTDRLYYSVISYLTVGFGEIVPHTGLGRVLFSVEGLISIIMQGLFMAVLVYKFLRVDQNVLIFSDVALISNTNHTGAPRLELRAYNNSTHALYNIKIKVALRHYLDTFPATNHSVMYRIRPSTEDYPLLEAKNWFVITSGPTAPNAEPRQVFVDADFLSTYRRFDLYVIIEAEYVTSGIRFAQIKTYRHDDVKIGEWSYKLRGNLDYEGALPLDNFNAYQ